MISSILIVEDEPVIADYLRSQVEQMGYHTGGIATNYESAVDMINANHFDLILLDINLGGGKTGIDLANYLNDKQDHPPFIYLTSYYDPATVGQAKTTRPAAYLTKPFTPAGIFSAIEIALYNSIDDSGTKPVTLMNGNDQLQLKGNDILYIVAEHVYVKVVTKERSILVRSTLSSILTSLPAEKFIRVHRSYIVNVRHIRVIQPSQIVVADHSIPIGRTFREMISALRRQ